MFCIFFAQASNGVNKKLILASILTVSLALPLVGLAGLNIPTQPTQGRIEPTVLINIIVNVMWWVFITVSIVCFIIIGILFLSNLGNPEEISKARRALIWGGVGIGVGIFAFGILRLIMNTLGF